MRQTTHSCLSSNIGLSRNLYICLSVWISFILQKFAAKIKNLLVLTYLRLVNFKISIKLASKSLKQKNVPITNYIFKETKMNNKYRLF